MWPLITAKSLIFSSGIVAWLPFIVPFPGNSSKQTKRPKSKRLKHSTFITCSIILFSSVKQLTLAFDDYEKKWQQNQRNLHDFEITFKKEIKIWLLHGSVTFKRAHSFGHLRGDPRGSVLVGPDGTPSNGLYGRAPTERDTAFSRFRFMKG